MEASARPGLVRGLVAAGYAYGTCASLLSELLTRGWHCAILGAGLGKAALVQKGVKMSAFLVGNKHIVAMVKSLHSRYAGDSISYYWQGNSYPMLGGQAQRHMGQVLAEQNYRSVAHLYGPDRQGDIVFEPFRLDPSAPLLSPVAVLQACDCYDYQSCETGDYPDTEAWRIVDRIRNRAIKSLPGYDEAQAWPVRG